MKPLLIETINSDDIFIARTPKDLDVIAYAAAFVELEALLPGREPEKPTPPEEFLLLPSEVVREHQRDWDDYQCEIRTILEDREEFSTLLQKLEARDPTGCWGLLPKSWVEIKEPVDPRTHIDDVSYRPRKSKSTRGII